MAGSQLGLPLASEAKDENTQDSYEFMQGLNPMSRASPRMRHFAKRLAVYERGANSIPQTKPPPAFQVCEKLRLHLQTFMGAAGFRQLLSCALSRAKAEVRWLRKVYVKADGSLEGLEELNAQHNPDELFEGGVVLVAQLLGLLTAFIGETLTLRYVREVWPEITLDNFGLRQRKQR